MKKYRSSKIIIPILTGIAAVTIIAVLLQSKRRHYLDEHESYLGGDDSRRRHKIPKRASGQHLHSWV